MIAEHQFVLILEMMRPSVLFRPRLFRDDDVWAALYGEDQIDGVVGLGRTPDEAMRDFDMQWHKAAEGPRPTGPSATHGPR
jgi:hypothetical protein